jgi:hypothetical protein
MAPKFRDVLESGSGSGNAGFPAVFINPVSHPNPADFSQFSTGFNIFLAYLTQGIFATVSN